MNGENSNHKVSYDEGKWSCDCGHFATSGYCAHTTAMEKVLENMVEIAA
jgi:hypothetical protein